MLGRIAQGLLGYAGKTDALEELRRRLREREEERQREAERGEAAGRAAREGSESVSPLRRLQRQKASEDYERARAELEDRKRQLKMRMWTGGR